MRRSILAFALSALLAAHPASAQSDESIAQEKFLEGREALKAGRFERARELFVRALALHPSPGTLLNLAFTEEKLGKVASASKHFSALADKLAADDDRGPLVQQHLAALAPRVPYLRVTPNGTLPVGARVALDDVVLERDQLGVELAIDPGRHTIVVTTQGRVGRRYEVDIKEGAHDTLSVECGEPLPPPAAAALPVPAPVAAPTPVNVRRVSGITIGAIGIGGLAAAGVIGGLTLAKKNELTSLCPDPSACTPEGVAMADSARSLSMAGTVAFAVGLAMAGAGAVLIFTSSSPKKSSSSISITPAPGGGALVFRGTL